MATKSCRGEKRQRKVPNRFKDNGMPFESAKKCEKWCSIENKKGYTCNAKALETGDAVTEADLQQGNEVIWRYTVEVKAVHDEKPRQRLYSEESSSDSEDETVSAKPDVQPPAKKAKKTVQEPMVMCESNSNSEISSNEEELLEQENPPIKKGIPLQQTTMLEESRLGRLKEIMAHKSAPTGQCVKTQPSHTTEDLLQKLVHRVDALERTFLSKMNALEKKCDLLLKSKATTNEVPGRAQDPLIEMKQEEHNNLPAADLEVDEKYISEKGVNLLSLRALNPEKYALSLMDALFGDEEMANCCFSESKRSTKPPLPHAKTSLIEECIDQKFGWGTFGRNAVVIVKKCNQKCLDTNKRLKNEKKMAESKELENKEK